MKLVAQDVAIRFGRVPLLQGVDLALNTSEMVGLIGPNGAGKTTLLRVLAGLRAPDAGTVTLDGRSFEDIGVHALAQNLSYLAQGGEVHWPMQAEMVVSLGRLPHRRPFRDLETADHEAVARAMAATGVNDLRHRTMTQLSGGERMRVLLARALAVEAPLLLADEPVAALDPLHQLRAMELLQAAVRRGGGVLVVLHDLSLAARFCDRLVLLADGGVIAQGAPAEVLTAGNLQRAYRVDMVQGTAQGLPFFLPR